MCTTCGCGKDEVSIDDVVQPRGHEHVHADGTIHSHVHLADHVHDHTHTREQPYSAVDHGLAEVHAPGSVANRMVQIEQDILAKNDAHAARNRKFLAERGIFALNLVSSPGSGK